jgi:ABC-type multidrug transport system ATPase subunit
VSSSGAELAPAREDETGVALALRGITKRWRAGDPPLLDALDLDLPPGTLAVVAGRNGVGKTTLLRIVAGLIRPDAGTVSLGGSSPDRDRRSYQRRIGLLSAGSSGLYARLTVDQHLRYWGRLALMPEDRLRAATASTLERFELEHLAGRRVDRLSMGQRQRVTLALAFLHDPALILFDEPWNSLDSEGIELVDAAVRSFAAAGGSGLVCVPTGHDLEHFPADRLYELERGKLMPS